MKPMRWRGRWWKKEDGSFSLSVSRLGCRALRTTTSSRFRAQVIPNFLVQFGISYNPDLQDQETILDEPQLNPRIPFEMGTIAFAGSGENSRDTHLFIALDPSGDPQWGKEDPWETPVGRVVEGLETVVQHFYSYGDDADLPEQGRIYEGPEYIEKDFPLTDKFETCTVERYHSQYGEHKVTKEEGNAAQQKEHATPAITNLAQPMDPATTTLGCLFLVVLGVLAIKCCFAARKMEDKRN
jgi:cyclophilin family peptidyl-prolyl cis-trans isomerase